jgi:hypothetical protein
MDASVRAADSEPANPREGMPDLHYFWLEHENQPERLMQRWSCYLPGVRQWFEYHFFTAKTRITGFSMIAGFCPGSSVSATVKALFWIKALAHVPYG